MVSLNPFANANFESKVLPKNLSVLRYGWGLKLTNNSTITNIIEPFLMISRTALLALSAILALSLCVQLTTGDLESSQVILNFALIVFSMSACGFLLRQFGLMGVRKQIQVDCRNCEVRIGYLGFDKRFRLHMRIKQSEIESAFLFRGGKSSKPSRLVVRLNSRKAPLSIMSGSEEELSIVLRAMIEMEERSGGGRRVKQRTTKRLFQASFGGAYLSN